MQEKIKFLDGTARVLDKVKEQKEKYSINIDGKKFVVYPNVFSPKYFFDTEFFAKELSIRKGDRFLEIGCGTGVISIFASWKGASEVVSIDINPAAVINTKENVGLHKLSNIKVLQGDVFGPLTDEKFDIIFWNTPFGYIRGKEITVLEKSVFDPEYKSTSKFIVEAKKYLKSDGRLVIGFSSTLGHFGKLKDLLRSNGYKYKIVKQGEFLETYPVKFEIIEAVRR